MNTVKNNQSITIAKRPDYSLNDVLRRQSEGYEIVYTPHVGNRCREDIYLTRAGIEQALVCRNQAYVDTIDRPHQVRVGGRDLELVSEAQRGVLTPFLEADGANSVEIRRMFPQYEGLSPAAMQKRSAIDAVPGKYVMADTLIFLQDQFSERICAILEAVSNDSACNDVFSRKIIDGRIVKSDKKNPLAFQRWMDLVPKLMRSVDDGPDRSLVGEIPSNAFMILTHAFRCLLRRAADLDRSQQPQVFTVSGPSMINYVKQLQPEMERMYGVARRVFPELPERFTYNFIPGAFFDFVPAESETAACTIVSDMLEVRQKRNEIARSIARAVNPERSELITRKDSVGEELNRLRRDFQRVRITMPAFSQYDVLQGGELIDPPALRDMPLAEIDKQFCTNAT